MLKVSVGIVTSLLASCMAVGVAANAAEGIGRIEGRVLARGSQPHPGVVVLLRELKLEQLTDRQGRYAFNSVPSGSYTLVFVFGAENVARPGVLVRDGELSTIDIETEWDPSFVEKLTVYGASRRAERIVEAPAAVTVVGEEEIAREASHGQLPKLLEFTPGVEVTQSGVYDYNFNTRGFNSSLNRRVATLIDGRDPSLPFLGAQEWAAVSFPLDDLASAELVRGPSAALYGANASSGVLNLETKQPRYSQGGLVRYTAGSLETQNVDLRYADSIGNDWYVKVTGGVRNSGDFARSRNGKAEYGIPCTMSGQTDCLPQEAVALDPFDDTEIHFGSLRFDKYMKRGGVLTVEGGTSTVKGPVFQTGIGRVQVVEADRPWARANYTMDHFNFLASYTARDAPEQTAMAGGNNVALDTYRLAGQIQTNWDFADNRVRVVGGASFEQEDLDSFDSAAAMTAPNFNGQTLILNPVDEDFTALFGQIDVQATEELKLVFAGRWDDSSLHDSQFSPKASVVWSMTPQHSLRLTYNEAFQVANYSEFFLRVFGGQPASTAALEGFCMSQGVACGLGNPTPVLALGNEDLDLEQISTIEIGYTGIIGGKTFLTLDYYRSDNEDFITDLLRVGSTSLGRINEDISPWVGPMAAETTQAMGFPMGVTVADVVRSLAPDLSTDPLFAAVAGDGDIIAVTYTNLGDVDTQGVDFGINTYLRNDFNLSATLSWFDFDIKGGAAAALATQVVPNTPEYKLSLGVGQNKQRYDWNFSFRWVDEFRWVVGPFQGDVPEYRTIDATYNYRFDDRWSVGVNMANAMDDSHYESFGGDLIERRALGHVAYNWQ